MGIFQKKAGDFGAIFGGRNKKEKMTSKENEDERSLVSLSKTHNKPPRKVGRKEKINTKFRRLREDWIEPGTPEYEPPKGIVDFTASREQDDDPVALEKAPDSAVPDAIDVSISACDTMSTLEGSLVEIMHKENEKKVKNKSKIRYVSENKPKSNDSDSQNWIMNFADKSFERVEMNQPKEVKNKFAKNAKKEKKMVEPKFYPLADTPSGEGSSEFELPTFTHPFSRNDGPNIQFTHSEDYENDFVEKVSSTGSDDFHQFIVHKMLPTTPPKPKQTKSKKNNNGAMKKAAETIAISLSSTTPQKTRNRMVPLDGSAKRSRKVFAEKGQIGSTPPPERSGVRKSFSSSEKPRSQSQAKNPNSAYDEFPISKKNSEPLQSNNKGINGQQSSDDYFSIRKKNSDPTGSTNKSDNCQKSHGEKDSDPIHSNTKGISNSRNSHGSNSDKNSENAHIASSSSSASAYQTDGSVLLGERNSSELDDSLLQDSPKKKNMFHVEEFEESDRLETNPFHIGTFAATFSQPNNMAYWSSDSGTFDNRPSSFVGDQSVTSGNELIDLIRTSSQRSESGASQKPDPSPKCSKKNNFDPPSKTPSKSDNSFDVAAPQHDNPDSHSNVENAFDTTPNDPPDSKSRTQRENTQSPSSSFEHGFAITETTPPQKSTAQPAELVESEKTFQNNIFDIATSASGLNALTDHTTKPEFTSAGSQGFPVLFESMSKAPPPRPKTRSELKPQPYKKQQKTPDFQNILLSQSSSTAQSHPSGIQSNPSGIPANAILASMLFRRAHSESTMALPGERGRPSDPFEEEAHDMPLSLELELLEQQTVSSITEDAGSFYHENFEKWNNRAHRALNNLYSSYHSASAKLNLTPNKHSGAC